MGLGTTFLKSVSHQTTAGFELSDKENELIAQRHLEMRAPFPNCFELSDVTQRSAFKNVEFVTENNANNGRFLPSLSVGNV